ncbi:beta-lactamase hydrolase domain-containing protein [Brevundimonas sp.]|uniref:beta-lactamase hydrolase domain-containing protein n=1 Tax=Brevundimonas sp. TaxID=1871086 RepID=UPI002FC6C11D
MATTLVSLQPLSPRVWVMGQVRPDQVAALRDAGFTCMVNHRPDDEEPGQPSASDIAHAAAEVGLAVIHAPVRGLPDAASVAATRAALDGLGADGKAVFFCRSGMRSAAAWAMAERSIGAEPQALRDAALAAGYDLSRVPL